MFRRDEEFDIDEARDLLRDYRAALPLCQNGALLKEELARLNLRAYALGLTFPANSLVALKFQEVVDSTSDRKEQGGLYAHMDEARHVRHWIDFLTELVTPAPELLAARAKSEVPPLL